MALKTVFKRNELKYLLSLDQKNKILEAMAPYMELDKYGKTTIRNIYFDTDSYRLIRNSIESPVYKEKLRIRSYSITTSNSTVFVELKKKYDGVVYKRRLPLKENEAMEWTINRNSCSENSQITKEIDYFLDYYKTLKPKVFISYEREAYYTKEISDFRITFDENILFRENNISLKEQCYGKPVLPEGRVLMEIKCSGGIPLWMVKAMSANGIKKTSFSKYGEAYKSYIFKELKDKNKEA